MLVFMPVLGRNLTELTKARLCEHGPTAFGREASSKLEQFARLTRLADATALFWFVAPHDGIDRRAVSESRERGILALQYSIRNQWIFKQRESRKITSVHT